MFILFQFYNYDMGLFTKRTNMEDIRDIIKLANKCKKELEKGQKTGELKQTKRLLRMIIEIDEEAIDLIEEETGSKKLRKAALKVYQLAQEAQEEIKEFKTWNKAKDTVERIMELERAIIEAEEQMQETARRKSEELEEASSLYFRFMNIREFQSVYRGGGTRGDECIRRETSFERFQGVANTEAWNYIMANMTDTVNFSEVPHLYKQFEDEYIKYLREARALRKSGKIKNVRSFAANKLRRLLLKYIGTLREYREEPFSYWPAHLIKPNDEESDEDLLDEAKIVYERARVWYEHKHPEHAWPVNKKFRDVVANLFDDPEYLRKNAADVRGILHLFVTTPYPRNDMLRTFRLEYRGYDVMFFMRESAYGGEHARSKMEEDEDTWYWGHVNPYPLEQKSLAVLVITPNREILQEVKRIVVDNSIGVPERAIPVYNTKGRLMWPK